ncbi:hypothetical protein GTH32_18505 [Alteromonas sp. 345S023]|uniref:Putative manganese efflux pump MntP n=2 Tax=Pseudomonadota TaxID=1224 RepID=A0A7X5RN34_9ALTE|nr:manganese efflux pump MntP family protein [Alteromonas profundi]NDV93165.1 hypothetical protein [Alteromonas profundi]
MNLLALIFLSFAMSTDAFAAAIAKGVNLRKPKISIALKTGIIFGIIEAITPMLGWGLGKLSSSFIVSWDHWLAFGILSLLGTFTIFKSFSPTEKDDEKDDGRINNQSILITILTAIGTSIDAMAVGISLAFVDVNIALASMMIGLATCLMVTIGIMVGSALGLIVGKRAETVGGIVLITVGTWVLISHIYQI